MFLTMVKFVHLHSSIRTFFERAGRKMFWSLLGYIVAKACASPRIWTSFTRPFLAGRRARAGHETRNILATSKVSYISVMHLLGEATTDLARWCWHAIGCSLVVLVAYVWRVQNTVPLPCCSRVSHRGVNSWLNPEPEMGVTSPTPRL